MKRTALLPGFTAATAPSISARVSNAARRVRPGRSLSQSEAATAWGWAIGARRYSEVLCAVS